MNDDFIEDFIRESEENIIELNNSLLALEDDPTDQEAIEQIFRTAHTLKGNFSAMGFDEPGDVAHAVEDLLDEIRGGNLEVTAEVMDRIFSAVDVIEAAIDEIEADGTTEAHDKEVIADLRGLIQDGPEPATGGNDEEALAEGSNGIPADVDPAEWGDPEEVGKLHVSPGDSEMPGVDGMMILETVADSYELLESVPPRDDIEAGDYDDGFDLFIETEDIDPVVTALESSPKVDTVTETVLSDITEPESGGTERPADEMTRGSDSGGTARGDSSESASEPSVDEIKSIRVDVDRLDELYNRVEQLVTSRIKLRRSVEDGDFETAADNIDELDKISSDLQRTVMDMRLIPLEKVVNTFPRLVRDLARSQDKEIDFGMEGTNIELDRTILDEISDPLMHVLRNSVDHGIEPPEEREAADKPREGTIRLRAKRQRDYLTITVEDDGQGLDAEKIAEKALENGVKTEDELDAMSESEIFELIFHSGFSTTEEVTDVSGRGVGMDVVRSTVNRLDGDVSVESTPGEGTAVHLRLPVTVAIVRVLFVEVNGDEFGIPIKTIDEITRPGDIQTVNGENVIDHDGTVYPVVSLRDALDAGPPKTNGDGMLLRIRAAERPVALRCDAVKHQEEVVIKPFEGHLGDVQGLSGTAVVGDGDVVPILDVSTL